jgi:hypothetical protein
MGISSDFTVDYNAQRIYHSSGATVYSVNALYSYLQDLFDELTQMNYTIPMSAQTPTDYTLINGWFINEQRGSGTLGTNCFEFLKGGAIKSSGYNTVIYKLTFQSGDYVSAVPGDIGLTVHNSGSTHTGLLLDYDNNNRIWWVRAVMSVITTEALTITSGTGAGTTTAVATGEDIWPNIYTLGSIDQTYVSSAQQIYIIQNENHISEWWPDSATPANRQIDVLVKTQDTGTAIDSGNLTIFLRHYPSGGTTGGDQIDLYDNFNLSAVLSGRNAVPLATANDLNNTVSQATAAGYNDVKIVFVNGTIAHGSITGGPFTALEPVSQATSGATGVFISESSGAMTLGNITGTFDNTNVITGTTSSAYTTSTGTVTLSNTTRVTAKAFSQDSPYNYSVIVDCAGRALGQVYEYLKYYTRIGATGSSFKTYMVQRTGVSTWASNILDGEQYIEAYEDLYASTNTFSPVKQSPFGTFAGGKLFGARGVWIQNMASTDIQSFQLIDSDGITKTPPNQISISVTNTLASDRVGVFATTGGNGSTTIWKAQYTSHATNNTTGNSTFIVQETIPSDTPISGSVRVVKTSDISAAREVRYTYTSWSVSTFSGISPTLTRSYNGGDTAYVPYIDTEASGTSVSATAIYASNREVLVRVRRHTAPAIIPFETTATITSTGSSTGTIRTLDTIST